MAPGSPPESLVVHVERVSSRVYAFVFPGGIPDWFRDGLVVRWNRESYDPVSDHVERSEEILEVGACHGDVCLVDASYAPVAAAVLRARGYSVDLALETGGDLPEPRERIELRPYQLEAYRAWLGNGCIGSIVMPTGAGKSYVALKAIEELRVRTLVLVPTIELAEQWRRWIERLYPGLVGVYGGGRRELRPIVVATYQSAYRRPEEFTGYKLLVADEAHHLPADKWRRIALEFHGPFRMALSATLRRRDGNEGLVYAFAGPVVARVSYSELAGRWLAPLEVTVIVGDPPPWEEREINAVLYDYLRVRGVSGETAKLKARLLRLVAESEWKQRVLPRLVQGKTIVFTEYVDHAYRLAEHLEAAGFQAAAVTGRQGEERRRTLDGFREGRIRVLVSTTVLDEGIDVPDAETVVVTCFRSPRQLIQRIGRVLRPKPLARAYILLTSIYESRYKAKVWEAVREAGWEGARVRLVRVKWRR